MQGNGQKKNGHPFAELAVLVAEDDPRYRCRLLDNLRSLGVANVRVERDCGAVLAAVGAGEVDVLVTGWRVGCMTAVDLLRAIRADRESRRPDLPMIMVTADTAKLQVEKARDAGVIGFLPLPLTPRAMAACLTSALDPTATFIDSPAYAGPDRRRQTVTPAEERRTAEPSG